MEQPEKTAEPGFNRGEGAQWVLFTLGEEGYAILAIRVQEIVRGIMITPIPNMPPFVRGICNLRGKIVPILDLKERFAIQGPADASKRRVIVAQLDGQVVGFNVDSVAGVFHIDPSVIEDIPASFPKIEVEYIYGVAKLPNRLVLLLNLDKLLGNLEWLILQSTQWQVK